MYLIKEKQMNRKLKQQLKLYRHTIHHDANVLAGLLKDTLNGKDGPRLYNLLACGKITNTKQDTVMVETACKFAICKTIMSLLEAEDMSKGDKQCNA